MTASRLYLLALATLSLFPIIGWSAGPVVLADSLKPNDMVTGSVKIGRRTFALPPGTWQPIASSERNAGSDDPSRTPTLVTLSFQELRDGRLDRILDVVATKFSRTVNWFDEP